MANNKGKNTSVAKPRRLGVGTVLSCLRNLRQRQSKAPQVLERSLATTVRRGSGRRTMPLDVEVEMQSTSGGGGGEIKEVAAGEEGPEITRVLEDQRQPVNKSLDETPALPKQEMEQITPPITQDLGSESISLSNTPSLTETKTEDLGRTTITTEDRHLAIANRSLDETPALPKQEMEQITLPITQDLGSESISLSNTPSLRMTEAKTEDLGCISIATEDQHHRSLDETPALPKQEMEQITPPITQDLGSESISLSNTPSLTEAKAKDLGHTSIATEDQHLANRSLDETPALPKQEMEQITPPITQDLGSESISLSNTPSLTEAKTEDLGHTSIATKDQHLANRSLDESLALPKQEMEKIKPPITQVLGSKSISVSNTPSLCVTEERTEDLGSASTVGEDQHLANRDAPKSSDQSSASSKQEMVQDTESLSSKSIAELDEKPTSSNLSGFDVSPLPPQLHAENTNENTMVENASIISGDQPISDSSGKNMDKLEYDAAMETATSSNANDFDASPALPLPSPPSIPLLPSLLATENAEELAVNTTMGNSSLVSNSSDHQLTGGKPPEQSSDSSKLTMDLATPTTQRDEIRIKNPFSFLDRKLFPSTSTPSRPLPHLPTIPYPSIFPTQSDDQFLAGNTERKAVDMPALPLKPEPTSNIGEKSKALMKLNVSTKEEADRRLSSEVPHKIQPIPSPTSSPFPLPQKLLPWMNGESSPYGYLLLVPIGMAIIFLALLSLWGMLLFFLTFGAALSILFAIGVFALSSFAVFAVAGTAVLSVWAGTLWAMSVGARTGLVVIKFLIAMVSSAARASMAVDV